MDFETPQMVKNIETEKKDDAVFVPKSGRKMDLRLPPFLIKTFEMVDDPETDPYVTWNSSGTGFIISDHNKFAACVLPTLFKTNNFASFVYQLNSYGFRKISSDRYEYGNQWFQAGKKHWLKNIKRRNQQHGWCQAGKRRAHLAPDQNSINVTLEKKLDALITGKNNIKCEIQNLRHSLDNMKDQLSNLEIPQLPEFKDKTNIGVLQKQVMEYLKKEKVDVNSKRPRLDADGTAEPAEKNKEKLLSPANDFSESSIQDKKVEKAKGNTEDSASWMEMLDEEAGFDSNGAHGDLAALHSKAMMELEEMMASNMAMQRENLIVKPSDLDVGDYGHFELWT